VAPCFVLRITNIETERHCFEVFLAIVRHRKSIPVEIMKKNKALRYLRLIINLQFREVSVCRLKDLKK
jgi:hypothetical protein